MYSIFVVTRTRWLPSAFITKVPRSTAPVPSFVIPCIAILLPSGDQTGAWDSDGADRDPPCRSPTLAGVPLPSAVFLFTGEDYELEASGIA
jgi:hypothetical protein